MAHVVLPGVSLNVLITQFFLVRREDLIRDAVELQLRGLCATRSELTQPIARACAGVSGVSFAPQKAPNPLATLDVVRCTNMRCRATFNARTTLTAHYGVQRVAGSNPAVPIAENEKAYNPSRR
jgi:hypothetical protein